MTGVGAIEDSDHDLDLACSGDDAAFTRLVAPLRRQLHAHCYRMLASAHDADDALQDALVRGWQGLPKFGRRSSVRSWLYTIATNTCLDRIEQRGRRALPMDLGPASEHAVVGDAPLTDVAWLGPYPQAGPQAGAEQQENVELAFVAALQLLPGNQRAALLLFDVLDFSAAEIADMMRTSTASVNSALQRARATMVTKAPKPSGPVTDDARVRELVAEFASALERGDAESLVALLTADVTWAMPPMPHWYSGIAAVTDFATEVPLGSCGAWRHLPTWSNGQPAVAGYLWDEADGVYAGWSVNVLTLREGRISEVVSFVGPEHLATFGLPAHLP